MIIGIKSHLNHCLNDELEYGIILPLGVFTSRFVCFLNKLRVEPMTGGSTSMKNPLVRALSCSASICLSVNFVGLLGVGMPAGVDWFWKTGRLA